MSKGKKPPRTINKSKINPETGLSPQQEEFCRQYLTPQGKDAKPFNATQAAIAAGYSPKGASVQGARLLGNVKIQAFLSKLQAPALKKFEVTQERIMEEVAALAFSNIFDFITVDKNGQAYVDLAKVTYEQARSLQQVEIIEMPPLEGAMLDSDGGDFQGFERQVLKVKIKTWDKLSALEKLMKRHGLLKEQIEFTGRLELSSTELARRMAFMLRDAAQRTLPPPEGELAPVDKREAAAVPVPRGKPE
jgi:phage terminase small subunit